MKLGFFTLNNENCFVSIQKALIKIYFQVVYSGFVPSLSCLLLSYLLQPEFYIHRGETKKSPFENNNPVMKSKWHWACHRHSDGAQASPSAVGMIWRGDDRTQRQNWTEHTFQEPLHLCPRGCSRNPRK